MIESTKEWEAKMVQEQAKTPDNESPKLLSTDIADKSENLKREVGYLVTKIKYFRPPTKKTPLKTDEEKVKTANKTNSTNEKETVETDETKTEESKSEEANSEQTTTEEPKTDEETTTKSNKHNSSINGCPI